MTILFDRAHTVAKLNETTLMSNERETFASYVTPSVGQLSITFLITNVLERSFI